MRYRIYGVFLLALGLLTLILGLMPPRTTDVIIVGGAVTRIKSAFESLHLWLVVCDDECALLLQKKDLRSGNADSFLSDIISKMNTGTDASG